MNQELCFYICILQTQITNYKDPKYGQIQKVESHPTKNTLFVGFPGKKHQVLNIKFAKAPLFLGYFFVPKTAKNFWTLASFCQKRPKLPYLWKNFPKPSLLTAKTSVHTEEFPKLTIFDTCFKSSGGRKIYLLALRNVCTYICKILNVR